jgi:short-subunit dehydrogenase
MSSLEIGFENKVVIVTGASSGIGRTTARLLAKRGAVIVAVARREALLRELAEECRVDSPRSSYLAGDLGRREFAEQIISDTIARHGRLDVLINNAGVPLHRELYRTSVERAEETMRINFFSCLWTTFAAIPHMLTQGEGHIVNVSSFVSKVVPTHESIYAASKCAMNGLSEGLWNDLAGSGIFVSLIHPGPIETEIWQKLDQPGAYSGKLYPAIDVAEAILEAIVKKRHEVVVPRRNLALVTARLLRFFLPSVLRMGVARNDPVSPESVEQARERSRLGKRLGEE